MKYTTFRNLLIMGALTGLVSSFWYCGKNPPSVEPRKHIEQPLRVDPGPAKPDVGDKESRPAADGPAASAASAQPAVGDKQILPLRPFDEEIVALFEQKPAGDKVKDATPNRPYKVNLYAEQGKYVRAKVDLNRNGKWDEKWSVDEKTGTRVYKRQVSPSDDDLNYPDKFKLRGKLWEKSAP